MGQAGTVQTRRERLTAPLSWWLGALAFGAAWGWVALVLSGWGAGIAVGAAVALVTAALVWRYGDVVVEAGPDGLRAGRATLPTRHVGAVQALDAAETRAVLGPQADVRAWLLVRPYVRTAVRVELDDPADPTPYWVVSTRRPDLVAAALGARPSAGGTDGP